MSAPESQTSADQALSSFMGAAIGAPDSDFAPNQPTTDEKQIARWKRDSELLDAIQSACWDVRFISHSNGDDYSIGIEIVSHFMQRPRQRVIGENWNENLRAALEQAMTAEAYPPARPERPAQAAGDARMLEFVREVAQQKPEKPDYWSSCGQCESNSRQADDLLDEIAASQQQEG
ncbi:hypothetical protein LMG26857_01310 [Achromobacter anxifer]|uniref:hypothetical protein n=1 Tax=Achromobacter anxifer TaxID=1287737 RepID=UPI00155BE35A|nr:hypothetical protein [Achromobacter anxifer]CAB5512021.1 hypothetical protein LMG26857_01310 [Achromobacter anxifer]